MNFVKKAVYQGLENFLESRGYEIQQKRMTEKQIGRYLSDECQTFAMISTIPKSGTHRVALFFYVLDQLASGNPSPEISDYQAGHIEMLPSMGVTLKIGHSSNPFMVVDLRDDAPTSWSEIPWYINGWNSARGIFEVMAHSGADRMVHIYRNPLDQSVSWFHMKKAQVRDGDDHFIDDCGRRIPLQQDAFLRHLTLPLWVRVHGSFLFQKQETTSRTLLISYEDLMREPEIEFGKILDFYAIDLGAEQAKLIETAVEMTSRDRVRALEDTEEESLLNIGGLNQEVEKKWRHARDGSSGQWKNIFSDDDIGFARQFLEAHGMDLDSYL